MTAFLIIIASLLLAAAIFCLYGRQTIAPALSYLSLLAVSFITKYGLQVVPINSVMLYSWLAMTLVVMFVSVLEPEPVRRQTRGMGYIMGGGFVGLAIGLLGYTFISSISLRYSCMILGVVIGILFGFLLYTRTPDGQPIKPGSRDFFRYLLAKGFPTAITLMMPGTVLVLLLS